ncbi:hypothetical protein BJX64DRAFT_287110 [Aspergillus heterothallicus]
MSAYVGNFGVMLNPCKKGKWKVFLLWNLPWKELLSVLKVNQNGDLFVPVKGYNCPTHLSSERSLKEVDRVNRPIHTDNEAKGRTRFDWILINGVYKVKMGDHNDVNVDEDFDEDSDVEMSDGPALGPFGVTAATEEIEPGYEVQLEWVRLRQVQELTDPMAL